MYACTQHMGQLAFEPKSVAACYTHSTRSRSCVCIECSTVYRPRAPVWPNDAGHIPATMHRALRRCVPHSWQAWQLTQCSNRATTRGNRRELCSHPYVQHIILLKEQKKTGNPQLIPDSCAPNI